MRPIKLTYTPADDDTDGFANDVNTTSGLPFTLSATSVGDGMAHLVIITPSGSVTGSYTITGTDAQGKAQTETLATNTTNAVTSVNYYLTVTQVLAPSGIGANTVDIGWTDVAVAPIYPINWPGIAGANIQTVITGTVNYTMQSTFANVLGGVAPSWTTITNFSGVTAGAYNQTPIGATAFRLLINSLTAGATVTVFTDQTDVG